MNILDTLRISSSGLTSQRIVYKRLHQTWQIPKVQRLQMAVLTEKNACFRSVPVDDLDQGWAIC